MLRFVWRSQVMVLTLTIPSLLETKFSHFDIRAALKRPVVWTRDFSTVNVFSTPPLSDLRLCFARPPTHPLTRPQVWGYLVALSFTWFASLVLWSYSLDFTDVTSAGIFSRMNPAFVVPGTSLALSSLLPLLGLISYLRLFHLPVQFNPQAHS